MSGFSSTRRRGSGFGPGARRSAARRHDDPLNPDVVDGPPEEMNDSANRVEKSGEDATGFADVPTSVDARQQDAG